MIYSGLAAIDYIDIDARGASRGDPGFAAYRLGSLHKSVLNRTL
jgi:hypothetical protein